MTEYENEFSQFPSKKITLHHFKNVDDTVAPVINQINELRSQGLYDQAARIIQNNSDILSQYVADAVTFRTWEEEIYNAQKYAKQVQQCVFLDEEEPDDCLEGDEACFMNPVSLYPETVDEMIFFQDNNIESAEALNAFNNLTNQGKYSEAAAFLAQHKELFGFFADYLNAIENRISRLQEYLLTKTKKTPFVDSANEPDAASLNEGSIWL